MNHELVHEFLNDPDVPEEDQEVILEAITILDNYHLCRPRS